MAFVKVTTLDRLPPGDVIEAKVGDRYFAVCNVAGEIRALDGTCPHHGGPLGQGAIHGTNVVCPWHAWEFDTATGVNDYNPSVCVATHAVRIDGADVLIDA
jgi:nitrite reductase (NADH) small subunit